MKRLLTVVFALSLPAAAETLVIQNANILTITRGSLKGAILIRDGKIAEVSGKVLVPPDARVLDAGGQYVMPGIIDCHSHIAAEAINEGSVSVSSMVRIEDVLNAEDIAIYRALAGGVTTIHVIHGSANTIGGTGATIKLRWGKDAAGLAFEGAKPSLKLALGENPKRAGSPSSFRSANLRYPATRMGVEDVLRETFSEARRYQAAWKEHEARSARGDRTLPPRRDFRLEPLVEVLEGRRLVHAHAYRADEILMMLNVGKEFGFRIDIFIHVLEGYRVAAELKAHNAGASTFSDWWAYKMEAADAIPFNAALMVRRGILTSLNSDSAELMRHLNQEAAKAVKYGGLTDDEALALITINPARQMEIDRRVGSIEPGKDADLVFFDRHPLSNYAKAQKVLIDGEVYFDRDRDVSERAGREARKKALVEEQRERQKKSPPSRRPQ